MGATKARRGLFSLGMLLLGSLVVVDAVWAQGEVSFIARRDFRVGACPLSVTVGDFNGDGRPDLATANRCQHRVDPAGPGRWHLPGRPRRGGGTFPCPSPWATSMAMAGRIWPPPMRVPTPCRSCWAGAMAPSRPPQTWGWAWSWSSHRGRLQWRWPAGSGHGECQCRHRVDPAGAGRWHLPGRTRRGGGSVSSSITVGDFNGDGRPDLATANAGASTVSILLGRGDGTFQAASDVGVGEAPVSVTVGDFNGDGRLDLATANVSASTVSILLGRGDGTFQAAPDGGGGRGSLSSHRGRLQWRWPPGSGHGESRCQHRVDPAGPGRWHLPGRARRGGGRGSSVRHRGRLQWRWPPGSGHGECRCQHRVDPAGPGRWHLPGRARRGGGRGSSVQSRWATSMAMAARIWPRPMSVPIPCRSCWAGAMAPSRPPQRWGWERVLCPSPVGDFNGDGRLDLATANPVPTPCRSCWGGAMAPSRPPQRWGWERFLSPSPWATSMAMAARIWPPRISVPTPCPSCWGGAMAPSRPRQRWGWACFLCPSPWATSMAMAARIWPRRIRCQHRVDPAGAGRWHLPGRARRGGGSGSFFRHRGRLQWRWPPGSGHGEFRCQHRVDPAGPGRWHLSGRARRWGWEGSCVHHGGRLQWRWPPGSGHREFDANTVSILLGRGDGTFQAAPELGWERVLVRHRGRLQWRWPAGSGHGESSLPTPCPS